MFDLIISFIVALAEEDRRLDDIQKSEHKAAYNALSDVQKKEVYDTYRDAYKYYREWENEEKNIPAIRNLDLLV